MKGKFVRLERPSQDDYALMAQWFGPDSVVAVMTATEGEAVSAEDFRNLDHSGGLRQFSVHDRNGKTVGAVHYRAHGPVGGYVIGGAIGDPELWSQGYGAEAFDLLLDHLFHARGAHRVQFTTAMYNKNVLRLATRAGFVLEGILREYYYLDGCHHDAVIWSLLRKEYYGVVEYLKRTEPGFTLPEAIPESDKVEARRIVADYLAGTEGESSTRLLLARVAEETANGRLRDEHPAKEPMAAT
ncbi:GNAT family N-acetyltransferase [Streptomyces sp. NBC_00525]|uniref:GNAT family N-acetyltransferase n=1 Tax=Streptomyces sp. NBC_00525 TaxID=2903660 RepID=UPI002E819416|nr:GNAT family protein [Streptomyces sp. NBC_00525]WUC94852.1 GNAT family N-acetyltransferase [Streptomyces sp. NBC_00525]